MRGPGAGKIDMTKTFPLAWMGAAALSLAACGDSAPSPEMIARGKDAFTACAGCHAVGGAEAYSIGPGLGDIYQRPAGSVEGFAYSDAMKSSGIVWGTAQLDAYLTNPQGTVEGTTMVFEGIQSAEEREAIIAYLRSISE